MNVERVELLVTLKADKVWRKGTILNAKDGPIPPAIIAEVRANKGTVRVLGPEGKLEKQTEEPPISTLVELKEKFPELIVEFAAEIMAEPTDVTESGRVEDENEEKNVPLTGGGILRMTLEQILDLLKDEEDFESLKNEKRTVLVGIARKRFVKNDQS